MIILLIFPWIAGIYCAISGDTVQALLWFILAELQSIGSKLGDL